MAVANKVRNSNEVAMIASAIGDAPLTVVPFSEAVASADRKGTSVFDEASADDFIAPIQQLASSLN
jgi:CO dehydrogenase nickel-insertion accessory protein CooC1